MTAPTQVPAELVAGDTWDWTRDLADYPASTWTATYYFVKEGAVFNIVCTANDTTHVATLAAATSALKVPGRYRWSVTVASGAIRKSVDGEEGWVEVLPNPAGTAYDPRPSARVVLDNIDAYLANASNLQAASFTYAQRQLSRYTFTELLALRSQMLVEVQREEAGSTKPRRLYARFDRA